ncbi:MAG: HD domain-containing protein [Anaerolineales bacterium]
MKRARYRVGQFRDYLWPRPPGPRDLAEARRALTPALAALFERQTPGEQAHALRVMRRVAASGVHTGRLELLQAALLHDVGKTRAPLSLPERVAVVLAGRLWPGLVRRGGWRPFVTARCHADWGAELCAQAGAPPLTVELVRRHQTPAGRDDALLAVLQMADDDN